MVKWWLYALKCTPPFLDTLPGMDIQPASSVTDTIPRASLESIVRGLEVIATSPEPVELEEVRLSLHDSARDRFGPVLRNDMLSTTRDVLADLRRLWLIEIEGPLPRPSQREQKPCLCRPTAAGVDLWRKFEIDCGRGYDELFTLWYKHHPHFANMIRRLQRGPFYLPEFNGIKHFGVPLLRQSDAEPFARGIGEIVASRMPPQFFASISREQLGAQILSRAKELHEKMSLETAPDLQAIVEKIQDSVIVPAVIACEQLEFDRVSLKHILKIGREFLACSSTSMLSEYEARAHFITCHLVRIAGDKAQIVHHGVQFSEQQFDAAMKRCYRTLRSEKGPWVDAYTLRAKVCVEMSIQQEVFNRCFETYVEQHAGSVATELSFRAAYSGETPIGVRGKEIGLIQLNF